MSQEARHVEVQSKTQQLLQGSLKHVRVAALAAALIPVASIAVKNAVVELQASGAAVPSPCDFVTSGGFVIGDGGHNASFGAHGGCKNGRFWGHINFVDHETGLHVTSTAITGYIDPAGTTPPSMIREICGWATTNQHPVPVRFRVWLEDNGEPGDMDQFGIQLDNGVTYLLTPRLLSGENRHGGGNVQRHEPNPSTTAPNPLPTMDDMCGSGTGD